MSMDEHTCSIFASLAEVSDCSGMAISMQRALGDFGGTAELLSVKNDTQKMTHGPRKKKKGENTKTPYVPSPPRFAT